MSTTAAHEQEVRSAIRADEDIVLATVPLRNGSDRGALSRFGDDVWDLDPAIFHLTARNAFRHVDFRPVACPWERLTAKEYIYAWLNEWLPDRTNRLRPLATRATLAALRKFMAFVREEMGQFNAALIDQELLDLYIARLKEGNLQSRRIGEYLRPISQLHRLAPFLTCGGLSFVPWNGRSVFAVAGSAGYPYENVTPRIPEPVIGGLLRWALRYVEVFAPDIFAARAELDALEAAYAARIRGRPKGSVETRMEMWIDDRRRAGRGIPVWNRPGRIGGICDAIARKGRLGGEVLNIRLVSLESGIHPTNVIQNRRAYNMLLDAVHELGVEHGGMNTPISLDPDSSRPWRYRFDSFALADEERYLQTAAYILCSYLTGMRDSEIQAMRPGCLQKGRSADGLIERLAIRSTIYKGRPPQGEMAEWVTIAPVAIAVEVAERLAARHRTKRQENGVWIVLHRGAALERGVPHIVRQINRFCKHLDGCHGSATEPAIPQVNDKAWVFNTRQFRRTVAWYIANRPFGVVAGKIQYKHASVAMFDGYAGSSPSGFRQEVEQERILGQLDDIVTHYQAGQRGERLAGPAAARIHQELQHVTAQIGTLPGVIADDKRVKAMLGHLARTLHAGHLTDCFFEPATALCLNRSDKPSAGPVLSNCAPDRCPNSCITSRHLPTWQIAIAHADEMLAVKPLSKAQRVAIRRDRNRMLALIAPLLKDGEA